jgi:hypothetical protein
VKKMTEKGGGSPDDSFRSPDGIRGRLKVFDRYDPQKETESSSRAVKTAERIWSRYVNKQTELDVFISNILAQYGLNRDDDTKLFRQ